MSLPEPYSPAWNFMAHDERVEFGDLESFRRWASVNPWALNASFAASIADSATRNGVYSKFENRHTREVEVTGENWRETIVAFGLNSRGRAMADELAYAPRNARILLLEAVTPFAKAITAAFPHTQAVEYLPSEEDRARLFPIQHCDITNADFSDASFDYVVSNDVLEHVPSLESAMRETRRILRPGGICLATFPFAAGQLETVVKAKIVGGAIVYLTEPEYHGNPVDPEGSLVFAIPAWDVLKLCIASGFSSAQMLFGSSAQRAITGAETAGVWILRAVA